MAFLFVLKLMFTVESKVELYFVISQKEVTHSGFLLMRNFKWDNKFFQGEFIPYKYRKNIIL